MLIIYMHVGQLCMHVDMHKHFDTNHVPYTYLGMSA